MEYTGQPASRFAFAEILYDKKDGIARVTLNRPEIYNAYSSDMLREMMEAFRDAALDDAVGVVVLTGAGDKAFCAEAMPGSFPKSSFDGLAISGSSTACSPKCSICFAILASRPLRA